MSINNPEYIAKSDNTRIEYPYNIINNFACQHFKILNFKLIFIK